MAKDRFVEVYSQGVANVAKSLVDAESGANYLLGSHDLRTGTGLTVLVDQDGTLKALTKCGNGAS